MEFFQDSFDWDQAAEVIVNPPQETQHIDFTLAKDADGDEMADDWEITHFGDLSHDGNADTDNDGLTDRDEYRNNTDPNDSDSDGDKLSDGYEFQMGTDPASNTSTPPIPITSVLHRVTESDGSLKTYIEVEILDGFVGTLPDDIDLDQRPGAGQQHCCAIPSSPGIGLSIRSGGISSSALTVNHRSTGSIPSRCKAARERR